MVAVKISGGKGKEEEPEEKKCSIYHFRDRGIVNKSIKVLVKR